MSVGETPSKEWEESDSTNLGGEQHARTIFIKVKENENPTEIVSETYVVPSRNPRSSRSNLMSAHPLEFPNPYQPPVRITAEVPHALRQ
jgi:hypothetical protein